MELLYGFNKKVNFFIAKFYLIGILSGFQQTRLILRLAPLLGGSCSKMFNKIGVLKNLAKLTRK